MVTKVLTSSMDSVDDARHSSGRSDSSWATVFQSVFIAPLADEADGQEAQARNSIFVISSLIISLGDILVAALAFTAPPTDGNPELILGYIALGGICVTAVTYAFVRLQQNCSDFVLTAHFLACSVRQYCFTYFCSAALAVVGTLGICIAPLVLVACHVETAYLIVSLVLVLAVFGDTTADVLFENGINSTISVARIPAGFAFGVAFSILSVFFAVVAQASNHVSLVALSGDDMKEFFSLRMADIVLDLVASLDFDGAAEVLEVAKPDVEPAVHQRFSHLIESLRHYKEFLPSALFPHRPSVARRGVVAADQGAGTATDRPRANNPLSVPLRDREDSTASTFPEVVQFPDVDEQTLQQQDEARNREFSTRRGSVVRVHFSLSSRKPPQSEADAFSRAMEDIVTVARDVGGEIEEATSGYVLLSFSARFTIVTHEQFAVDCAVALHHSLSNVFRSVFISVASGVLNVGSFFAEKQAWLVVGGSPVELVTKMSSLQVQIQCPIAATIETVSKCRNTFLAVDVFRPSGPGSEPKILYEMCTTELTAEVREDFSTAFGHILHGADGVSSAIALLAQHEESIPHARRLLRVLRDLPEGAPYRKDEVPWVSSLTEPIPPEWRVSSDADGSGSHGTASPSDGERNYWQSLGDGTGSQYGNSVTRSRLGLSAAVVSLGGGRSQIGVPLLSTEGGGTVVAAAAAALYDDYANQTWNLSTDDVVRGHSSSWCLALGSQGTLAAAVQTNNVGEEILRDVVESCGTLTHQNVGRVFGVYTVDNDETSTSASSLLTEYFPNGNLKAYLKDYGEIPLRTWTCFMGDILRGFQHLAQHAVIHGCLRPSCVFVAEDGSCNITKYGFTPPFAVHPDHVYYCAPEYFTQDLSAQPVTTACDVWCVGITALELLGFTNPVLKMFEGTTPEEYQNLFKTGSVHQRRLSSEVSSLLERFPKGVRDIVLRCLHINPARRSSVADLIRLLDGLVLVE